MRAAGGGGADALDLDGSVDGLVGDHDRLVGDDDGLDLDDDGSRFQGE